MIRIKKISLTQTAGSLSKTVSIEPEEMVVPKEELHEMLELYTLEIEKCSSDRD